MSPHGRWLAPLLLIALCAGAFHNAFPNEFVYDAQPIIRKHELLRPQMPWHRLLTTHYWGQRSSSGLYRPVTMLTYRFEKRVLGFDRAWAHAAVNLALHTAVVLLLWRLALRWGLSAIGAFAAAALFAVHPVGSEVVGNLVGRADLLATLFLLLALLAWARRKGNDRADSCCAAKRCFAEQDWGWIALAGLCWVLGLYSKEQAVVFPAIAIVYDRWRFRAAQRSVDSQSRIGRWPRWPVWVVLVGVGAAALAWRAWVLSDVPEPSRADLVNPIKDAATTVRWMTAIEVLGRYLRLAAWPQWMSAEYSFNQIPPVTSPLEPRFLIALLVIVALLVLTVVLWRKRRVAGLGLVLFWLTIFPVSNLPFGIGTIMADRLIYSPLIGLCLAAGDGLGWAWTVIRSRPRLKWTGISVFAVVLLALSLRTVQRNAVWHDWAALWTQTYHDAPRSARNLTRYASVLRDEGSESSLQEARRLAQRALALLEPKGNLIGYVNLATMHLAEAMRQKTDDGFPPNAMDDLERARQLLEHVIERKATNESARQRWQADQAWRARHGYTPREEYGSWEGHYYLGLIHHHLEEHDEAIRQLRRASRIDPDRFTTWAWLARSQAEIDDLAGVEASLLKAMALEPEKRGEWMALSRVYLKLGRYDEAVEAVDRAINLKEAPEADELITRIYAKWADEAVQAGDWPEAERIAAQARTRHRVRIELPEH